MRNKDEREALVERLIKGMATNHGFRFAVVICFWDNADLSFHTGSIGPIFQRAALHVTAVVKEALKLKDTKIERPFH